MEISQPLLLASLLPLFVWLLLQASPRKRTNGQGGRHTPSPPALPVLGHLHLLKKPLHRSLAALATRYDTEGAGLLHLRFGAKRVVLVTSPAVAEECFTVHDVALADRPGLASRRVLTQDCPAIAMCSYGPLWRHLRRLATVHALCAHRLAATSGARDAEARAMAAKLWRRAGAGAAVGVKAAAYEFAANVIMAMVAGTRMTGDQVRRFREMTEAGLAAAGAANRHDSLPVLRMLDFGRTRRRLAGIAEARRQFGQSILDDYRRRRHRHPGGADDEDDAGETARTVLGDLLRQQQQQEEQSPEHLDDVVIRSVCLVSQLDRSRPLHDNARVRQQLSSGGRRMHGRRRHRREMRPMCTALTIITTLTSKVTIDY